MEETAGGNNSDEGKKKKKVEKQTYKYRKDDSIVDATADVYSLTDDEYNQLHLFYVTYSMCKGQSGKARTPIDYGWENNEYKESGLIEAWRDVLKLQRNGIFAFTDKNNLRACFAALELEDGILQSVDVERGVIGKTAEANQYLKLFHHVRNVLAHGNYSLRLSGSGEKMVVMQDNAKSNVTARFVLKLQTLLDFISATDRNGLINRAALNEQEEIIEEVL